MSPNPTPNPHHAQIASEATAKVRAMVERRSEISAGVAAQYDFSHTEAEAIILSAITEALRESEEGGRWVPVDDRLPKKGERVFVIHMNGEHPWRAIAEYWPAGTLDATMWDDPPEEWWDVTGNKCVCPIAGWWESCFASDNGGMLSNVTHWMALPDKPDAARNAGTGKDGAK